jgi:hypothetical protein
MPSGYGDPDDVFRSLRRYVAQMLGSPPWTVRLQRTAVADDARPVAVLEPGLLATPFARRAVNQGDVQKQQPFTVVCYPVVGATAVEAAETARATAGLLDAGFSRGLVTDADPPVLIGAPWRLPVYAYAGVPLEGAGRQGPADPYMHAAVDQTFTVRPIQDAMDELRYTVVANLRVSWWQGGRIPPTAPLATGGLVPGRWSGALRSG